MWMIIGWYDANWWEHYLDTEGVGCTVNEMRRATEGYISTDHMKLNEDDNTANESTVSGLVSWDLRCDNADEKDFRSSLQCHNHTWVRTNQHVIVATITCGRSEVTCFKTLLFHFANCFSFRNIKMISDVLPCDQGSYHYHSVLLPQPMQLQSHRWDLLSFYSHELF